MPRSDPANFSEYNNRLVKEPRFYIEVMFDDAYTDPYYFTSHDDVDLPSTATSSNTFYSCIKRIKNTSQKFDVIKATSTIGGGDCELIDIDGTISDLLATKWSGGEALREKRFRTYVGYKGLANADYVLASTNLKQGHTYNGTSYVFKLEDLQRNVKKNIFVLEDTTLTQSVTIDQVAIPVQSTTYFVTNYHDANYTDLASQYAGYISIKVKENKEVISWLNKVSTEIGDSGTDISFANADSSINATTTDLSIFSAGQFITVSGSASNSTDYIINTVTSTKITLLDLDGTTAVSITTEAAGPTVTLTAPVQFYNCTRGTLNTYSQPYEVDTTIAADRRQKVYEHVYLETDVPSIIYALLTGIWLGGADTCPWNLGIDTSLINSASFTAYADINSRIFRFSGEKKIDGKKFIQEQLLRPLALYLRVLNDGDLALKRATPVLSDASPVRILTEADILNVGTLNYDDSSVYNEYAISWNWEDSKEETTRTNILIDQSSITKQKYGKGPLTVEWRGLHGSAATLQDIYSNFNMLRDRYAGPPLKWTIQVLHKHNDLEIGDIVRVTLNNVRDATNTNNVDRSFEIQGKTIDWLTGNVTLELFGSTEKSGELSSTSAPTVLSDTFYQTGTQLSSVLTISADAVTANGSLTGAEDGASATFYHESNLTINSGITITTDKNVRLYVKGQVTLNGTIDSSGGGDTNGDGAIGITKSTGGLTVSGGAFDYQTLIAPADGQLNEATYSSMPFFDIKPDSAGDTLSGLPADLQGMVGPTGGSNDLAGTAGQSGTTGGNGGGGLIIVCRGISAGVNGKIITSGNDSTLAGTDSYTIAYVGTLTLHAGSGGGGAAGGVLILIDGNDYSSTLSNSNFDQYLGDSPKAGNPYYSTSQYYLQNLYNGNYVGYDTTNQNNSFWRVQYVPDTTTAVADATDYATNPTTITPTESTNVPQTTGQNLSTVQIDITAPAGDSNYAYSNVYYKEASQTDYTFVGPARNSVNLPPTVMDGSTYDVIAKPVSVAGIESESYTHTTTTVSNAAGYVTMANGNHVKAGQTAYDTGTGFYLGNDSGTPKFSIGNSAANKLTWDGTTLNVTGVISVQNTSDVGGFTISATQIYNSTNIILDSSAKSISINDATFGNNGFQVQYNSGTPRLYVGDGANNFLKFDGTETSIGREVKSLGSDAYENDNIYISGYAQNYAFSDLSSGSGSVTANYYALTLSINGAGAATADFRDVTYGYHSFQTLTFSTDRRFKCKIRTSVNATSDFFAIGTGKVNSGGGGGPVFLGFYFKSDGNIYSVTGNGSTQTQTSLQTFANATSYTLEVVFTSGTDCKFYVDGTLKRTETATLPTGTTNAHIWMSTDYTYIGSSGGQSYTLGQFKLEQQ